MKCGSQVPPEQLQNSLTMTLQISEDSWRDENHPSKTYPFILSGRGYSPPSFLEFSCFPFLLCFCVCRFVLLGVASHLSNHLTTCTSSTKQPWLHWKTLVQSSKPHQIFKPFNPKFFLNMKISKSLVPLWNNQPLRFLWKYKWKSVVVFFCLATIVTGETRCCINHLLNEHMSPRQS